MLYSFALLPIASAYAGDAPPAGPGAEEWRQVQSAIVEQVDAEFAAGEDEALRGGITAVHGLIRRQVLVGDYSDLPAQDAPNGPEFGYSVAMEGEWLVVGAPGTIWTHDNHGTAAHGAVFVFRRGEDGNWSLFQRLLRANGTAGAQPGSRCGHAVVLRFPHMTFGCPDMATAGVERRGQIYHYRFAGVTFQPSSGTVSGPSSGRRCGAALALTPNYLAIGCPTDGSGAGQVRIVRRAGNDTFPLDAPEAVITPGIDVFGLGWSVAMREPGAFVFGEPGNVRLAIGAPNTIFAGTIFPRGSAFVYQRALGSATWSLNATMRPAPIGSDVATGARFGEAVAMNRNQLLVGAPNDRWASVQTLPGPGSTRRYTLVETLGSWSWQVQEVSGPANVPDGVENGMRFGAALGLGFDNMIAVGAPGTPSTGGARPEVGLAEVRRLPDGEWSLLGYWGELRPSGNTPTQNNAAFGSSLAFDVAERTLAVGVPGHRILNGPFAPRGQVWLYVEDALFANGFQCATGLPGC